MADVPRYRFGPLERRGVLAGLRVIATDRSSGSAALLVVATFRVLPPARAAGDRSGITASRCVLSAFVPVGGRALDEWLPFLASWSLGGPTGDDGSSRRAPTSGSTDIPRATTSASRRRCKGITILSHAVAGLGCGSE